MSERIVIQNGIARHIRETILSEAPFDSLAPHMVTRLPVTFPVMPTNPTRFIGYDGDLKRGMLITETPPRNHTIQVKHYGTAYPDDAARADADGVSRFRVQLPYTYFVFPFTMREDSNGHLTDFTIGSTGMLWRRDPYRGPEDEFSIAAVPNVDEGGAICWGSTVTSQNSFSEHIDAMINEFFVTQFNEDLGHRTPFGNSLLEWEANSGEPLAFRNWQYWNDAKNLTVTEIWNDWANGTPMPNMASLNPAHVDIPELPQNFTILRAREWIDSLPAPVQARLRAAMELEAATP